MSVVQLPGYLVTQDRTNTDVTYFQRQTRTFNNSDRLKLKCTITPRVNAFKNSFFYRSHLEWNMLPLDLRLIEKSELFKSRLEKHLWQVAESKINGTS